MVSPIEGLKERILNKNGKNEITELTRILDMSREFGCLGEITGRDFEIRNPEGELVYRVHQKPMAIKQMRVLIKEFVTLKNEDNKRESEKWGGKGKGGLKNR